MRIAYAIALCVFLAGCQTTVPVHMSFPQVPEDLRATCPPLKQTDPNTTKLSEVIKDVSSNYAKYNECRVKIDAWNNWYDQQKKIFEDIK